MERRYEELQEYNTKLYNENVAKDDRNKRIAKQLKETKFDL